MPIENATADLLCLTENEFQALMLHCGSRSRDPAPRDHEPLGFLINI